MWLRALQNAGQYALLLTMIKSMLRKIYIFTKEWNMADLGFQQFIVLAEMI